MSLVPFLLLSLFFAACTTPNPKQSGFLVDDGNLTKEKSDLYFSIGESYKNNGKIEQAIENYQKSIEVDSKNHKAHFNLGKLLLEKRFTKRGVAEIKKAIAARKDYTEARNFLAYFYFNKLKRVKDAQKLIDESAGDLTYFNQEETWALKLKIESKSKNAKTLLSTVPRVLALQPKVCKYRLDIATTLYKMSFYGKSLESARMADDLCQSSRDRGYVAFLKSLIFIKRNDYHVAEKMLGTISTQSESFKKILDRTQTAVRKKINSGI